MMIRQGLKDLGDYRRYQFQGTFSGVGFKVNHYGGVNHYQPTIVFAPVMRLAKEVTDHLWFNYTKQFIDLWAFSKGDIISFDGRVTSYHKGIYPDVRTDYKIERPTKVYLLRSHKKHRAKLPDLQNHKNALIGYIMETNKEFYQANGRPYEPWYVNQYHEWLDDNK